MNVYCLACDRAGHSCMIEVSEPEDLHLISDHYVICHPDVDLDEAADADIVTIWPHRLRSRA